MSNPYRVFLLSGMVIHGYPPVTSWLFMSSLATSPFPFPKGWMYMMKKCPITALTKGSGSLLISSQSSRIAYGIASGATGMYRSIVTGHSLSLYLSVS